MQLNKVKNGDLILFRSQFCCIPKVKLGMIVKNPSIDRLYLRQGYYVIVFDQLLKFQYLEDIILTSAPNSIYVRHITVQRDAYVAKKFERIYTMIMNSQPIQSHWLAYLYQQLGWLQEGDFTDISFEGDLPWIYDISDEKLLY